MACEVKSPIHQSGGRRRGQMAQTGGPARLGYPMEGLQAPQLTVFSRRAHRILLAKLVGHQHH